MRKNCFEKQNQRNRKSIQTPEGPKKKEKSQKMKNINKTIRKKIIFKIETEQNY